MHKQLIQGVVLKILIEIDKGHLDKPLRLCYKKIQNNISGVQNLKLVFLVVGRQKLQD